MRGWVLGRRLEARLQRPVCSAAESASTSRWSRRAWGCKCSLAIRSSGSRVTEFLSFLGSGGWGGECRTGSSLLYVGFPLVAESRCMCSVAPQHVGSSWWVSERVKSLSRARLIATPWTVAYQASPSMGFSRQEYWSGLPFPSPGDLPDPGIEPGSPASEPPGKPSWTFLDQGSNLCPLHWQADS